jgi:hypothetical protein
MNIQPGQFEYRFSELLPGQDSDSFIVDAGLDGWELIHKQTYERKRAVRPDPNAQVTFITERTETITELIFKRSYSNKMLCQQRSNTQSKAGTR